MKMTITLEQHSKQHPSKDNLWNWEVLNTFKILIQRWNPRELFLRVMDIENNDYFQTTFKQDSLQPRRKRSIFKKDTNFISKKSLISKTLNLNSRMKFSRNIYNDWLLSNTIH